MDPNPWNLLLKRTLCEPTDNTLHLYTSASEKVADPQSFVDRLDVAWVWQLKAEEKPFHEVAIVETEDRLAKNETRSFVLDRVYHPDGRIDRTEVTEVQTTSAFKHRIILIILFQIAFNDQKPTKSTSYPPVLIPTPQLSARDSASLAAVRSSYKISESMEKNDRPEALDRFFGEAFVGRYADWKCVRQIKPQGLKFFDFVVLAHVVHMEAPTYTALKDNCYWYVTTVIDAVVAHCGVRPSTSREDARRETRYSFDPDLTGRWNGLKITASDPSQISVIVSKYEKACAHQILKV
jgi:hypothetical protein